MMKKKFSVVLSTLIVSLVCCLAFVCLEGQTANASAEGNAFNDYYCREALGEMSNCDALVYAYDSIVAGVEECVETISVYDGSNPLSMDELKTVLDAYRRDRADQFWLGITYNVSSNSETVLSISPTYLFTGTALTRAREEFDEAVTQILSGIDDDMTEFEKELYLHDALAQKVSYVEASNAHNAFGALVEGQAVCEGYAEALQYLLHRAGIQSFIALGKSAQPGESQPENHAWNVVRVGGNYYHVDLTWNDQSTLYHAYFNVSDEIITMDHSIDVPAYALPQCNSNEQNYFEVKGGALTDFTADAVGMRLKQSRLVADFFVVGKVDEFTSWLQSNLNKVIEKAGVIGEYSCSYACLGGEVKVFIDACLHEALTEVPSVEAECDKPGNVAYFICECGRWFTDATATEEIKDRNSVVTTKPHAFTKLVEDEEHLKQSASSCKTHATYYLECDECGKISYTEFAEGSAFGDHEYSDKWTCTDTTHCKKCVHCDSEIEADQHTPDIAEPTTLQAQKCLVCGHVLRPAEMRSVQKVILAALSSLLIVILYFMLFPIRRKRRE